MTIKKYVNTAFIYAMIALVSGLFYREFTKIMGFTGATSLSIMHTHYFALGMFMFLFLALLEKNFKLSEQKGMKVTVMAYNIGLNVTVLVFLIRGIMQVLNMIPSTVLNASLSGIAGIGHIILAFAIAHLFVSLRRQVA